MHISDTQRLEMDLGRRIALTGGHARRTSGHGANPPSNAGYLGPSQANVSSSPPFATKPSLNIIVQIKGYVCTELCRTRTCRDAWSDCGRVGWRLVSGFRANRGNYMFSVTYFLSQAHRHFFFWLLIHPESNHDLI